MVSVTRPPCARAAPVGTPGVGARPPSVRHRGGFSLIEVVVVIVLLGIIAAIAIPRLSRGSEGSIEAAAARDLSVLQKAIDLYAAEHDGAFPHPSRIAAQLTQYTDSGGTVSTQKVGSFNYGPYVRKVPPLKAGPNRGNSGIATAPGTGVGWIYNPVEGTIAPNTQPPLNANPPPAMSLPAAIEDPIGPDVEPLTSEVQ